MSEREIKIERESRRKRKRGREIKIEREEQKKGSER